MSSSPEWQVDETTGILFFVEVARQFPVHLDNIKLNVSASDFYTVPLLKIVCTVKKLFLTRKKGLFSDNDTSAPLMITCLVAS